MANFKVIQAVVGQTIDLNYRINGGGIDACIYELATNHPSIQFNPQGGVFTATGAGQVVVKIREIVSGEVVDMVNVKFITETQKQAIQSVVQNVLQQAGGLGYGNGGYGLSGYGL